MGMAYSTEETIRRQMQAQKDKELTDLRQQLDQKQADLDRALARVAELRHSLTELIQHYSETWDLPILQRAEAVRRMIRAEEIKEEMKPITMQALSNRYRVCWKTLNRLEQGENLKPKHMTPEEIDQAVSDLRRYRELEAMHETREDIARDLGVLKFGTVFYHWMKEYRDGKPDTIEYDDPVVSFLTMPSVVRNPVHGFYY